MKAVAVSLLAGPVLAFGATIAPRAVPTGPWSPGVWKIADGTDLFFFGDGINASGNRFWLNKNASTYCPSVEGLDCSLFSNDTTILAGGNDTTSLYVAVPGGQQVYVAPDGALAYTTAHSASIPEGSVITGFWRTMSESFGAPIVWGMENRTWQLCPVDNTTAVTRESVFQVYLTPSDSGIDGCYGTEMRTYTTTDNSTWEYT